MTDRGTWTARSRGHSQRLLRFAYRVWGFLPRVISRPLVLLGSSSYVLGTHPVVIRDDGRMLLVRQSYGRAWWATPGGFVNRGESPVDGAVREVREEAGLEVVPVGEPLTLIDERRRIVQVVVPVVVAEGVDPDSAAPGSAEIVEVRWFNPDALPELQRDVAESVAAARHAGFFR